MNIRNSESGYVTHEHILKSGFVVTTTISGVGYELPQYRKGDNLFLTGGYWTHYLEDKHGNMLWEGWWNSNEEFDKTVSEVEKIIANNE